MISNESAKEHWDRVYASKGPQEVSWTQEIPAPSLELIHALQLPHSASIIDIGGGDSKLVDHLLEEGFHNITVLDISINALEKAQKRLGEKAGLVKWIVSDITHFEPPTKYDLWHDRAAFHFLTESNQVEKYICTIKKSVTGYLVLSTFSTSGPLKCSGLPIIQYNESNLNNLVRPDFEKLTCKQVDHTTPFGTLQNFLFCSFKRKC